MIPMHRLRLMVALTIMHLPMMAMNEKYDLAVKKVGSGIYKILVGASDGDMTLYDEGTDNIYNGHTKRYLKRMTFKSFRLMPVFEHNFLKALVVHKEKRLLSIFLDMYNRSYPRSRDRINFTYTLEKKDGHTTNKVDYTLLDVALVAYCQALEEKESGEVEADILTLLVDKGGELTLYRDSKDILSEIAHPKKRRRRAPDQQESLTKELATYNPHIPSLASPFIPSHVPLCTDVGLLVDIKEIQEDQAELDTGVSITFDLNDSK